MLLLPLSRCCCRLDVAAVAAACNRLALLKTTKRLCLVALSTDVWPRCGNCATLNTTSTLFQIAQGCCCCRCCSQCCCCVCPRRCVVATVSHLLFAPRQRNCQSFNMARAQTSTCRTGSRTGPADGVAEGRGQEKTNLFESESSALISSKRSYISQGQLMSNKELYKVLRSQLNVK